MRHPENSATPRSSTFGPLPAIGILLLAIALAPVYSFGQTNYTESYLPSAYGTYAFVGNTVLVGQTAPVSLTGMCGLSQQPLSKSASAAAVNLPPIVSGGAVNTAISSAPNQAHASSNTSSISLLAGLISAQAITAQSTTTLNGNGSFQVSAAGSNFSNLIVLGRVYNGSVAPNTRINLPLVGYVVLNEQISSIASSNATMTVNMLHVYVTVGNLLGLQVGTQVIVSSATSGIYNVPAPGIISGYSYGTQLTNAIVSSSQTAPEILPCLGTQGNVLTNAQVNVSLPGLLTSATVSDTVESNLTPSFSSGENTSTIQGLNLLSGLVTATVMRAQVDASVDSSFDTSLTGQDQLIGISVLGHPEITDNIPNNTSVSLLGLGTLYLKRVLYTTVPYAVEARSLELVVNQNNVFGLPIGLDLIVGDAYIAITRPLSPTACNPTSSLSLLLGQNGVVAYIPNGNWGSSQTGIQVVPIEPPGTATPIATAGVVNSCASNSVTGETVCTANDTDVYLINGTNLLATLTSGSTAATDTSGGNCFNCGVAIESNSNTAVLGIGYSNAPSGSAIQFLNLGSNTFSPPVPAANEISEDVLWDPIRQLILSPDEDGIYDLYRLQSGSTPEYGNTLGGTLDSAGEDCLTGIALSTDEFTSNIVLTDLTQATFTAGSPGTWTAPLQFQAIPEWDPYDGTESGTDGIAVATGSHLGIISGEFPFPPSQANAVMVVQLPSTSGTGTPALVDYAVVAMPNDPAGYPFSIGCDPHTVAAYVSPTTGKATGIVTDYGPVTCYANGTPQYVALVDLQGMLNAPRLSGTHTVDPSYDLVGNHVVTFVATH